MSHFDAAAQRAELQDQRRKVDFDSYDITVDELVRRVSRGRIEIAPSYQRQFRWGHDRQSRLIESLMLGIPVPPLFMATNVAEDQGRTWEVVDGLQRLLSLTNFLGDTDTRQIARLDGKPLRLTGLEILAALEGCAARDLPADLHEGLLDRPVKVIVLNDKSDLQVRFDLFERLNTGGVRLTDHEVREAVYAGEFIDLLTQLANSNDFQNVVNLPAGRKVDGTPQDFVLRFFAFYERYTEFDHSVRDFLNDFCRDAAEAPSILGRKSKFVETFDYLAPIFPNGLRRGRQSTTPVNVFEAVAVGAALALDVDPDLEYPESVGWIEGSDFRKLTTGATNDRRRVAGRVEFARDRFLASR